MINSVTKIIKTFDYFSPLSGLKTNKAKCEIARSGVLKGVKLALCSMEGVNLNNDVIKIFGIRYDKKLENEKNFLSHITYKTSECFEYVENEKFVRSS